MDKFVSVIVPCYNQGEFLEDSLQSLVRQTYTNWECIIVNDGSSDNTKEIALRWCESDYRIKYIEKENGGLSSARNAGLHLVRGDFIQFLDADDLIEENKFKEQLREFERDERIDVVYSVVKYFQKDSNVLFNSMNKDFIDWQPVIKNDSKLLLESFIKGNIMACNCPLIRKEIINKVGFFNENLTSHEDYEYWVRIALAGGIFFFSDRPKTYALVRLHDRSMSNNKENMAITALFVKHYLVKQLLNSKINFETEIIFQFRSIKKDITKMYFQKKISKDIYWNYLNFFEKIKFFLIPIVSNKMQAKYVMFDFFDLKDFFKKYYFKFLKIYEYRRKK